MKHRLISMLLAVCLVLSLFSVSVLAAGANDYPDVSADDWYAESVRFVTQNGLMTGTGRGFEPDLPVSRATVWMVLSRLDGQKLKHNAAPDWYAGAQFWAVRNDISDGTDPNGAVTREQLAAMLYRFAVRKGLNDTVSHDSLADFEDASLVSEYAVDAMRWAVETGLIGGADGKLLPQSGATRAQLAQILLRMYRTWSLPEQSSGAGLTVIAAGLFAAAQDDAPAHTHSWQLKVANADDGTHTLRCADCGEEKTELCDLEEQADGSWKCSVCGFTVPDAYAIETWDELNEAVNGQATLNKFYIVKDIAIENALTLQQDTEINGLDHTLSFAESAASPQAIQAGNHDLTLKYLTLDGAGMPSTYTNRGSGLVNGEPGSTLTIEDVTIQNVTAERIIRSCGDGKTETSIALTNVTLQNNTLTGSQPVAIHVISSIADLQSVTINENNCPAKGTGILIYMVGATAQVTAENLIAKDNTGLMHILATMSCGHQNCFDLKSGELTGNDANFFLSCQLTIGEGMRVENDIVFNNDSGNNTCTLTNNGTIVGDITVKFTGRGSPVYTGNGTHIGSLDPNFTVQ